MALDIDGVAAQVFKGPAFLYLAKIRCVAQYCVSLICSSDLKINSGLF